MQGITFRTTKFVDMAKGGTEINLKNGHLIQQNRAINNAAVGGQLHQWINE